MTPDLAATPAPRRRLDAAASAALAPVLAGPTREAVVVAAFPRATYVEVAAGASGTQRDLVAVVTADGVHLPNALVLGAASGARPMAAWRRHRRGWLGAGTLVLGDVTVEVSRWWRPRPTLPDVTPARFDERLERLARRLTRVAPPPDHLAAAARRLVAALAAEDVAAALAVARRELLGWGPGLTPAGDDVLAGAVAGTQLLTAAVAGPDGEGTVAAARRLGEQVAALAVDRTTTISAALLRHAVRAEVAAPVATLLHRLTGAGALEPATERLLGVGSTSGRDLTVGLLVGGAAALAVAARAGRKV